jgi:hypothetical protein
MKNRVTWFCLSIFILLSAIEVYAAPAFPGAEGYGAVTPGGRGGRVIVVTNTNAGGAGSLLAAMLATGPRIIVFQTSGVINLGSASIRLEPETRSFVTVAGQTSPGGITLTSSSGTPLNSGYTACRWHDGIFRFIRFRVVRNTGGNGGDHACAFYQAKRFIFDHCDFSGGDDENFDFMYTGDFTVQWCTVANSGPGGQRYGFLMNGSKDPDFPQQNISIHHNLLANHAKRGPEIHWGYGALTVPDSGRFDFRSNIMYNIGVYGVYFSVVPSILTVNLVGNYFKTGPITDYEYTPPVAPNDSMHVFIQDNYWESPGKTSSTALSITSRLDPDTIMRTQYQMPTIVQTPWNFAPVTTTPAHVTYDTVLARVGAFPRDSMNRRTVQDVINTTGRLGDCDEPYITSGPAAPADADMDGIINDLALARLCNDYYNPVYPIPVDWVDYNPGCCKSLAVETPKSPLAGQFGLIASPNPFKPSVQIRIAGVRSTGQSAGLQLTIYDAGGRLVHRAAVPATGAYLWNAENLGSGIYVAKVTFNRMTATRRLILQ